MDALFLLQQDAATVVDSSSDDEGGEAAAEADIPEDDAYLNQNNLLIFCCAQPYDSLPTSSTAVSCISIPADAGCSDWGIRYGMEHREHSQLGGIRYVSIQDDTMEYTSLRDSKTGYAFDSIKLIQIPHLFHIADPITGALPLSVEALGVSEDLKQQFKSQHISEAFLTVKFLGRVWARAMRAHSGAARRTLPRWMRDVRVNLTWLEGTSGSPRVCTIDPCRDSLGGTAVWVAAADASDEEGHIHAPYLATLQRMGVLAFLGPDVSATAHIQHARVCLMNFASHFVPCRREAAILLRHVMQAIMDDDEEESDGEEDEEEEDEVL